MGIGIFFAVIVSVLGDRFVRSKFLKPNVKVVMKTGIIVINKNGRRNVHRASEEEPLFDPTLPETSFHLPGNVYVSPPCGGIEPKLLPIALHLSNSPCFRSETIIISQNRDPLNLIFPVYFELMARFPTIHQEDVRAELLH